MMKATIGIGASILIMALAVQNLWAGQADVIDVKVRRTAPQTYAFDVSVHHADTGWDHYADQWDVVAPDGTVLATRVLFHPHVDEQPFTRSLSGVRISTRIKQVTIRAHDKVHGWGGRVLVVDLPGQK